MSNSLNNWTPYQLDYVDNEWVINWLDLDHHHINEPFFDETISLCRSKMLNRSKFRSQSSLAFLLKQQNILDTIPVTAFIFHVSRCGSTLLSQALSNDRQNIVIAEAPIFDEILRASEKDKGLKDEDIKQCFMAALNFMGQKRYGTAKQYFIKLDSWHLHSYQKLRSWFPDVPFYFLTREPNAIIASHKKKRGIHAIPGYLNPEVFQIKLRPAHYENFNLYTADVLAGYYKVIRYLITLRHPNNHFYDYGSGVDRMLAHFFTAIGFPNHDLGELSNRLAFHSKYPGERFKTEEYAEETGEAKLALQAYRILLETLNSAK